MMRRNSMILWYSIIFVLLAVTIVASLTFGATDISPIAAIRSAINGEVDSAEYRIIFSVRLPRCIAALLAGSALAVSGVLIQAVLDNPMAAPNIIGVNAGAGLAVIATVSLFPSMISLIPFSAFFGALICCVFIFLITSKSGAGKVTITLVGIAVTSILNAGISTLKLLFPNTVYNMTTFSVGGLGGVNTRILIYATPLILICIIVTVALSRGIDVLSLGEETAGGLGLNVGVFRFILLLCASALAGAAVSFAGLLGFVGLVVPHIVRRFTGNKHCLLIPCSALVGALFVLLCDFVCRILFKPYEIPVGILLSFIGGIFFVFLILTYRKGRAH